MYRVGTDSRVTGRKSLILLKTLLTHFIIHILSYRFSGSFKTGEEHLKFQLLNIVPLSYDFCKGFFVFQNKMT